jgi:hypothetical protein
MRDLSVEKVVGRCWSRWLLVSVSLLVSTCLAPSSAGAKSYHDFLCEIPYGPNAGSAAPTDDVTYSNVGTYSQGESACSGGNGVMFTRMDGEVEHPANGSGEYATFTAPSGLTIAGFNLWHYEQIGNTVPYGPPVATIAYGNSSGSTLVEFCDWEGACAPVIQSSHLANANEISRSNLNGMTYIQWTAVCGDTGASCPKGTNTEEDVYAADIDLVDDTPPMVGGVSGPLVAGGALTGKQSVSFNASDGQSGVYGGSLVVDGSTAVSRILNTNGGACESLGVTTDGQRSFEHAQPCLPSLSASLTLDTSQLTPGQHSLELIVEDAAGNQTIAYNGTITVAGSSQGAGGAGAGVAIGPGSPLVERGAPNGTNASDQAKLTARWEGTSKQVRTSRYGAVDRVTGRLVGTAGQPISGAVLDVSEMPAYEGARAVPLARTSTGPTGAWALTLPRGISSGTLSFDYRSHLDDTIPVATATLTLKVHAGIALRIAPRVVSVGRSIFFSGTLRGTPIPPGGKQLVLEARSRGGEWIQFDTLGTDAKGRYRARYRFKFPGPIGYQFRVLSRYEADFPFLTGASNIVDVYER